MEPQRRWKQLAKMFDASHPNSQTDFVKLRVKLRGTTGGTTGDTDRFFISGQELRGNCHAFWFGGFPERYRLVKSTILKKFASISPKWDLNAKTAQIDRRRFYRRRKLNSFNRTGTLARQQLGSAIPYLVPLTASAAASLLDHLRFASYRTK